MVSTARRRHVSFRAYRKREPSKEFTFRDLAILCLDPSAPIRPAPGAVDPSEGQEAQLSFEVFCALITACDCKLQGN